MGESPDSDGAYKHLGKLQSFDWIWRGNLAIALAQVTAPHECYGCYGKSKN